MLFILKKKWIQFNFHSLLKGFNLDCTEIWKGKKLDFSMLFIKIQINTMGASWSYYMYTHNKFRNIFDKETYVFFIID